MGQKKTIPPPQQSRSFDPLIERGLPSNPEAEKAVLGAVLLDNQSFNNVASIGLVSDDFSIDANRRIFQRMQGLSDSNSPIDFTTLGEELTQSKEMEAVGGYSYLSTLTDGLPRSVNAEHYARIVRDKALLRRTIHAAHNIMQEGLDGGSVDGDGRIETVREFVSRAQAALFDLGDSEGAGQPVSVATVLDKNFRTIGERPSMGLETGFARVDEMTRGLLPGEFTILAARPSIGKTSYALDVAMHQAVHQSTPAAVFSLEMTKESLVNRMICTMARVDSHKYRSGFLSKDDLRVMSDMAALLHRSPLYIDDTAGISLYELAAKAKRLVMQKGIKLIVVDYLQLMTPPKAENRNMEVTMISRGLKALIQSLKVASLVLCQLSRKPEMRGNDNRPQLSDLRESGALENDADLVKMLYREEYYLRMRGREVPEDVKGRGEVIIAKARNGPVGRVPLAFMDKYSSFGNIAGDGYE